MRLGKNNCWRFTCSPGINKQGGRSSPHPFFGTELKLRLGGISGRYGRGKIPRRGSKKVGPAPWPRKNRGGRGSRSGVICIHPSFSENIATLFEIFVASFRKSTGVRLNSLFLTNKKVAKDRSAFPIRPRSSDPSMGESLVP